jgi:hypothetical protein
MSSPKRNRTEQAYEAVKYFEVEEMVERIARFKGKVRPLDYPRLHRYASILATLTDDIPQGRAAMGIVC